MSSFNNFIPVCVQLQLQPSLAVPGSKRNGNFTWYAPFRYSTSPTYVKNNLTTTFQYNLNDIKPGHWIAGNRGLAWRIYNKQINTVKID